MIGLNGGLLGTQRTVNSTGGQGLWTLSEQILYKRSGTWPGNALLADPYFAYTSLLLPMDGSNGGTNFIDNSLNTLAITAAGNAQISNLQSKFGGFSAKFDGAGDYLTSPTSSALSFTGDFTIELWVYPLANAANTGLLVKRVLDTSGTGTWGLQINNGTAQFSNLQTVTNTTFGVVSLNTWTHLAVCRSGSTIRMFLNGELNASIDDSTNFTNSNIFVVGAWGGSGSTPTNGWYNGYIDDIRITKGIARYTVNFTPPTQAFYTFGAADPYLPNTSLLLHMNGGNGNTTFTDDSNNALALTVNGDAQISTAQSKFDGSSGYFDGNGDFLTIPSNSGFTFNGDFTIECWAYFISVSSNKGIIASSSQRFGLIRLETRLYWIGSPDIDGPNQTLTANTWTHLACSRQGSTLRLFVNGNLAGSGTTTETPNLSSWYIANDSFSQINNVYIDDLRVTQGIARYTANFAPPVNAFADAAATADPYFATTSLLLHMNGENGSTTFVDSSNAAVSVNTNGDVKISTAQSKFGGASASFDGSGDALLCTLPAFNANDFTIESWIRITSHANYRNIYESRTGDADTLGFVWGVNSSGQLYLFTSSAMRIVTGSIPLNTWTHVALTRSAGTWRVFINGAIQAGSYSSSISLTRTAVRIGLDWANLYYMNGYMDDYRITNGVARYTSSFTPSTSPHPNL